jgi:1,4-alpha-glucan branching enzyme
MGQEFAQRREWSEAALDWHLLNMPAARRVQPLVRDLNHALPRKPALHARDCEPEGFEWLIVDDHENSVFAWVRKAPGAKPLVAVISNFTPVPRENYRVPLPQSGAGARS